MRTIRSILFGGPEDPAWARPVVWALTALTALLYFAGTGADPHPYALVGAVAAGGAVFALYAAVTRLFGHGAGALAALALALSPVGVGLAASSDALALLLLILAAHTLTPPAQAARPAGHAQSARSVWHGRVVGRVGGGLVLGVGGGAVLWSGPWGYTASGVWGREGGPAQGAGRAVGVAESFADVPGGPFASLLPFALVSLVAGLVIVRGDRARTVALLLWGAWTAIAATAFALVPGTGSSGLVFLEPGQEVSVGVPPGPGADSSAVALLGPGVAALAGIGAALMGRAGRPWPAVLAVCAVGTAAVVFVAFGDAPGVRPWLRWAVVALALASAALMARKRLACGMATLTGLLAGLAAPALLALSTAGLIAPL
ncbi:hypothetical protein [Actinocorallia sp. A-T 12471]|uniref:hypothetical protein n=1 Tax=Actinocorallia sp. A-T 12471 TaxID=3089813 RepID=UPI0029D37B84|nr:hypothetical protein [Actinocorallia sp. A-T 12471]MDX6743004.1 hypothetical protein [Actinocorallia sp. A-T 12471]